MANVSSETKKRLGRSPRYPFIPLEKALDRAYDLYRHEGKHPFGSSAAAQHLGVSPKSSGFFQTLAALKMYGLLDDQGSNGARKLVISDSARRYFMDEREDQKAALLKHFAQNPKIMADLLNLWGTQPPSEATCRSTLKVELGFTESAVGHVLQIYHDNIAYAGLGESDTIDAEEEEPEDGGVDDDQNGPEHSGVRRKRDENTRPPATGKVRLMESERIVFTEENDPGNYVKIVASGQIDENLLDALGDYIQRQKKRLGLPTE